MTNREKFKQTYGFEPDCDWWCTPFPCNENNCRWWKKCEGEPGKPCEGWWDMEYEPIQEAADHEEKGLMAIMGDDGIFREYKDEFDITIHCGSQEEQDQVKEILNQQYISKEDLNKIIAEMRSRLDGVNITLDVLVENDALIPRMEGAKTTLEECLSIIAKYTQKEAADDTEQAEE